MNISRILIASGLCAMLLSTGCSSAPVTRSMAANDAAPRSHVTRSFDGYRNHNNYRTRNRFGSPVGRGYNVRSNRAGSDLRIGDELTPYSPRTSNFNTPRRTHAPAAITQTRTETKSSENTKRQAPGSAAKVRATQATEKLHRSSADARKSIGHEINKTREANETAARATKHTPQTTKTNSTVINRSAETLRTPQHSSNFAPRTSERAALHRATPRHTYSNVERGIVRTRNTANEVLVDGHGLNNDLAHRPYRAGRTENRSFLRGYRLGNGYIRRNARNAQYGSRGYVLNYNNGYDGVIRDYRFGDNFGGGHGFRHNYGGNYGHNYARRSHARYPMHYGYQSGRAISSAVTRGTNFLRDGAQHNGVFRANNFDRGYSNNHYQSPMFGYGYNNESNLVNHPYGYGTGEAGHLNGQIVNVPYIPGVIAGS